MRRGFTLVELLVVLVLMGLALAVVVPVLHPPAAAEDGALAPQLRLGRAAAIRRGEPTLLTVDPDGRWEIRGRGSADEPALAGGEIATPPAQTLRIVFSPLGTCAPDAGSTAAAALPLDLLDCALRAP